MYTELFGGKIECKASYTDNESDLCLSSPHWKKSLQFLNPGLKLLVNDLVQVRTKKDLKKDLKCLSMSFSSSVSVAFQKCVLFFRRAPITLLIQCSAYKFIHIIYSYNDHGSLALCKTICIQSNQ